VVGTGIPVVGVVAQVFVDEGQNPDRRQHAPVADGDIGTGGAGRSFRGSR
jgi:hypothetical protein